MRGLALPASLKIAVVSSSAWEDSSSVPILDLDDNGLVQFVSGNGFQVVDEVAPEERAPGDSGTPSDLAKAMHVESSHRPNVDLPPYLTRYSPGPALNQACRATWGRQSHVVLVSWR
jgi:hypothetical protein